MTLYMQLEYELAATRGINLRWLAWVAPETAQRWREDNRNAVRDTMARLIRH